MKRSAVFTRVFSVFQPQTIKQIGFIVCVSTFAVSHLSLRHNFQRISGYAFWVKIFQNLNERPAV